MVPERVKVIWTQWSTSSEGHFFCFPLKHPSLSSGCVMAAEHQPRSKLSLVDLLILLILLTPDSPEFSMSQIYLFGATLTSYKTPDGVERTLVLIQLGILVSSLGPTTDDYGPGHPAKESSFHLEPSLMERRPTVDKHRGYSQDVEQRPCRPAMLPTVDCSRRFVAEYLWCSRSSASRTRWFRLGRSWKSPYRVDSFRAASLPQPWTLRRWRSTVLHDPVTGHWRLWRTYEFLWQFSYRFLEKGLSMDHG